MFKRSECKKKAKNSLSGHYLLFVFICLTAAMIGTDYTSSYNSITGVVGEITSNGDTEAKNTSTDLQIYDALNTFQDNHDKTGDFINKLVNKEESKESSFALKNHLEIGHYRGVLANIVNQFQSGAFLLTMLTTLYSIFGSSTAAMLSFVLLALFVLFCIWAFITNVFKVVYARMFLEGRIYKRVPLQRVAFLIYVRKWGKASATMLLKTIYYNLWLITIVGGIIKHYSYFAVPYIVAENPAISSRKAIRLSRDMMNGHKWECFKIELSFIGWNLLSALTFGIIGILFVNPYQEATMCEYYAYVRELAKKNKIANSDELNDEYLYKLPSEDALTNVYGPVTEYAVTVEPNTKGAWNKILDFFGVYFVNSENETYKEYQTQKVNFDSVRYVFAKKEYAQKLFPLPERKRFSVMEHLYYNRRYSIWSLILLFAVFSGIGWIWEVSLHLVSDGTFVNRGALHGPWLPIYGTGGIVILLILNKLRKKPVLEFFTAIALCGIVEYTVGWMMEASHNGQRWWSYKGYFLNVDGRVCAEGLFVFGLGGMAIVYLLAPFIDDLLRKIPQKLLILLCVIFLVVFTGDNIYSSAHPNTGKGITTEGDAGATYQSCINNGDKGECGYAS